MMARSHYPTKTVIVVEGDDDASLFEWHTNVAACRIEVAYGREKVLGVVAILDDRAFRGALAILDADFMALDGTRPARANILLTDFHDVECMLLASPALDHVLLELGEPAKIEAFVQMRGCTVVEHLLRTALVVGYARWASARNSWGLRFRRLDFTRFTALATLSLDRASFVATVRGNQGGRNVMEDDDLGERIAVAGRAPPSAEDLAREIQELERLEAPPWHVCCGHDAVAILSIGLRRALGSRNDAEVKETRLESMLRLAYDRDHFRRTNLYTAIRAWETANAPFTVF